MALVTIRRDSVASLPDSAPGSGVQANHGAPSSTESYFVVSGAAMILRKAECRFRPRAARSAGQEFLGAMFSLVSPLDTVRLAVRLESAADNHRYAIVVSRVDRLTTADQAGILGVDLVERKASIGLVMPVFSDLSIVLSGDGALRLSSNEQEHLIKPVTVQAMWSVFQCLNRVIGQARKFNYYPNRISHSWLHHYTSPHLTSPQHLVNEWNINEEVINYRQESLVHQTLSNTDRNQDHLLFDRIRVRLRELMTSVVDLDQVTSKYLRERLEQELDQDLSIYGKFIDDVIIQVFAHLDSATQIESWLFLGSEWNASNYEELVANNVGYVLNVSREIDNFFPADFVYLNLRVTDDEQTELIRHWDRTFRFINEARINGIACLVHCKMGISRSASTVIAYLMKENRASLSEALDLVFGHQRYRSLRRRSLLVDERFLLKKKRPCIRPNNGFMQQLKVYEGMLMANQVSRFLFPVSETQSKHSSYFDWSARFGIAANTLDRIGGEIEGSSCSNTSKKTRQSSGVSGADYVFYRFMASIVDEQKRSRSNTVPRRGRSSQRSGLPIPKVTKPDGFWIRSLENSENQTLPHEFATGSGCVRRRVFDFEALRTQNRQSTITTVSCENLNNFNGIERLVKLYSNHDTSTTQIETSATTAR